MKYKLAVSKIWMIGSPALVLGFCRYDDDDEFWEKFQLFTAEEYVGNPEFNQEWIEKLKKYHGKTIEFSSIGKSVEILQEVHNIHLDQAKPLELTKAEWELLTKELNEDQWQDFDWETWGK